MYSVYYTISSHWLAFLSLFHLFFNRLTGRGDSFKGQRRLKSVQTDSETVMVLFGLFEGVRHKLKQSAAFVGWLLFWMLTVVKAKE